MMNFSDSNIFGIPALAFGLLAIWELVWKGIGLWYAAKNNQKYWYIAILLVNSVGILPILYLYVFGGKQKK